MINNLFSVFDPSTNIFNLSINWIRTIIGLLFLPFSFWFIPNRHFIVWKFIIIKLHNEFKILLNFNKNKGSTFIFISLFSYILFNNFLGLFPYIFTRTSHLSISLSLSLSLWISFILFGWINNSQHIFIHIIPQGTPRILIPFIVLIETIRNIIRPGTLAIRLTANIIAGHLLLTLLSNTGNIIRNYLLILLIFIQIILLILERAVAIIQSYVITILSTLYSRETN